MSRCQSCGAEIVWARTKIGRAMPVESKAGGNVLLESQRGELVATVVGLGEGNAVSHFATCPDAKKWRRSR